MLIGHRRKLTGPLTLLRLTSTIPAMRNGHWQQPMNLWQNLQMKSLLTSLGFISPDYLWAAWVHSNRFTGTLTVTLPPFLSAAEVIRMRMINGFAVRHSGSSTA